MYDEGITVFFEIAGTQKHWSIIGHLSFREISAKFCDARQKSRTTIAAPPRHDAVLEVTLKSL